MSDAMTPFSAEVCASAAYLVANEAHWPGKDKMFISSLLSGFNKGKLSANQQYWLNVMATRVKKILNPGVHVPAESVPAESASATTVIGSFSGVYKLFVKAKEAGLKHPSIKVKLPTYMGGEQIGDGLYGNKQTGGSMLELTLAGPKSKYSGKIILTDGEPFGKNKFYGVVNEAGVFVAKPSLLLAPKYLLKDVSDMLVKLGQNPAEIASVHGKITGHCMFCNLALTDPKSVSVGYGPICAEKWGLPWGGEKYVEKALAHGTLYSAAKKVTAKVEGVYSEEMKKVIKQQTKYPYLAKDGSMISVPAPYAPPPGEKATIKFLAPESEKNPTLPPPAKPKQEFPF